VMNRFHFLLSISTCAAIVWQGHTHVVDYLLRRGRASQMMLARSSNAC